MTWWEWFAYFYIAGSFFLGGVVFAIRYRNARADEWERMIRGKR